ncbi:hypothetical protein CDAR_117291 [Caerostris darwini]|uniref:Uncharacterized protein n=1 Tax=Caerostris darwini TaxID=1538125 RepID=A0AAV4SMJ2_9ARAC|nr:hypothetical protein CDAR_117291 [Caerostris darwini]
MLKGQLEESRNFNREILTDNLKAITEAINTTKQVQPAPTKSFAEAVKKQQTTVILAPKDKDQSVKDMRSNISKQLKKSGELDGGRIAFTSSSPYVHVVNSYKTTSTEKSNCTVSYVWQYTQDPIGL